MATIENLAASDMRAFLEAMTEPELIGQQLVQQGGIYCLTFLLENGGDPALAREMLTSLQKHMESISDIAERKGFHRLFINAAPTGLH
jgi:hypothetical protein